MDNVLQLLQTVIVICIVLSALLLISLDIFYKGRKKHIRVIFKRITKHGGLNSNRSNGHTATIILLTANIPTVKSCTHSDVKKLSLIY